MDSTPEIVGLGYWSLGDSPERERPTFVFLLKTNVIDYINRVVLMSLFNQNLLPYFRTYFLT